MLNLIQKYVLYLLQHVHTSLKYRIRCWIQFSEMHCTSCSTSTLHSNTEQDAELNSGRCTVSVAALAHCTRIQNKMLNWIQEDVLYMSQHLHTALKYRTRCWTEFRKMYCTCHGISTLHSNTEQDAALEYRTRRWTEFRNMYCTCRSTSTLNSITEQDAILNSGRCTVPVAALPH